MVERILVATNNVAKFERYRRVLNYWRPVFEISKPSGLGIKIKVDEKGASAEEIAKNKALEYLRHSKFPTLTVDEECVVDGMPNEMQPGVFVRRVNRKFEATDEELLNTYVEKYAGKWHTWRFAHCLALPGGRAFVNTALVRGWFHTVPASGPIIRGYPLSSLLHDKELGKYWKDFTIEEERVVLRPIYLSVEKLLNQASL